MQNNNLVKKGLVVLSGAIKNVRNKKRVIVFSFLGCFFLYMASAYLLPAHRHFHLSQIQKIQKLSSKTSCLDNHLGKWNKLMEVNDAVVKKIPGSPTENRFFPFTGNGNIGFGMEKDIMAFYLLTHQDKVESYLPVLDIDIKEESTKEEQAVVLSIKEGLVSIITTYIVNKSCVLVEEVFFVHRKHSRVFHHEIEVFNKGMLPITVSFKPHQSKKKAKNFLLSTLSSSKHHQYQSIHGEIETNANNKKGIMSFVTIISSYQPTINVRNKDKNKVSLSSITEFQFTPKEEKSSKNNKKRRDTQKKTVLTHSEADTERLITELTSLVKPHDLFRQHIDSWNEIWKAGVTISSDSDPNSPSPLHVNLTEYYLYSTFPYNLTDVEPMSCFSGPSTVHMAEYWVIPTDFRFLYQVKTIWEAFFRKNGCATSHLTSLSLSKLMILSMIGFQSQKEHLQMALNPLNLRSNISIRHISLKQFHSPDSLDIRVVVTQGRVDSLLIYVTSDGKHKPTMYGCASACELIVELGTTSLKFPVHTTDPVTPLFYISPNRTHLEKISHTPFMKVAVKTAQDNHANPHHLKLSPKFWLAVVVLIVSFHVVVLKMIYNECRKNRTNGRGRSPYIS